MATLSYFPFVYVPAAATLRRLDPAIEESARALGSSSTGVFLRAVLPQLRLATLGGGLLIGVHLLAEYGAFAMLRFATLTTAIFEQFQSTFNGRRVARWRASWSCCASSSWWARRHPRHRPILQDRLGAQRNLSTSPARHGIPGGGALVGSRFSPSACRCGR